VDVAHKLSPAATSVLVVACLLVAVAGYATLVEVVGGVGRIHYPGATLGEQVAVLELLVVLLPVDAEIRIVLDIFISASALF